MRTEVTKVQEQQMESAEKTKSAMVRDRHLQMEAFREQQFLWQKNSKEQLQKQQLLARRCEALQLECQERHNQRAVAMQADEKAKRKLIETQEELVKENVKRKTTICRTCT